MSAPTANRSASGVFSPTRAQIPQRTLRTDRWWLSPLVTNLGFAAFIIYATMRAFWGSGYLVAEIPLPDAVLLAVRQHVVRAGRQPPLAAGSATSRGGFRWERWYYRSCCCFRLTCYYYRKAYYRSVWQSPTACAVAEPRAHYTGETRLPLIIQNSHRYFFYFAVVVSVINTYDAIMAFHSIRPSGFGFGLGNVILVVNVILLWAYTRVLPFVPARHRRAAQALLQTPGAVLDLDPGQQAEHPAHACSRGSRWAP